MKNGKRILVPLDGSKEAEEILPEAETMARIFGSKLYLFHATPEDKDEGRNRFEAEQYLSGWVNRLESQGWAALSEIRSGPPAREAVAGIRELGLDSVAMTTHGRSGKGHGVYGSVGERIIREAGVPVMLLRNKALRAPLPSGARKSVVRL